MGSSRELMLSALFIMFAADESFGLAMNTSGNKVYQLVPYSIKDLTTILFQVKACRDIHVLLMADATDNTNAVYEIVFGGWGNTKSTIRKKIGGQNLAEDFAARADCDEYKSFWIDWTAGTITIGEGLSVDSGAFLTYEDAFPTLVNYYKISTGWGASGMWNLGSECRIHGDPHTDMLDGTDYTYSGVCWYYLLSSYYSNFFIRGHYERCRGHRSCVDQILIKYKIWVISLLKKNTVKVNSNPVDSFPYTTSDDLITITYTPSEPRYKYKVQLPNAVNIKWDGIKDVLIEVGLSFYDGTRGLCGTYNLDSADDFTLRNGTVVGIEDKNVFGNNWAILSGAVCRSRMKGFRVFVTESEFNNTTDTAPVYISPSYVEEPGPVITIPVVTAGRYVRIDIPDREEYLTLCEVEIYGDDTCILV